MNDIYTRFEIFELEQNLFELKINEIAIWERLRLDIFNEIIHQIRNGQFYTDKGETTDIYSGVIGGFLKNIAIKNPFFANNTDVMYVGHQRRKKSPDGYWWDIYTDPLHEVCEHEYIHFELPYRLEHLQPARTSKIRYLDLIKNGGAIQRKLGINKPKISPSKQEQLKKIASALKIEFNASIDLVEKARSTLHQRKTQLWLYKKLLQKLDPELLVLVVGYSKENLIEASKHSGIPTVELQHGNIYEHHFGYSFPGPRTKEMFPDYLLTFGEFWKESVEFPIPEERIISVGYPYLEQRKRKYADRKSEDQILFISQPRIGTELSKFALEVDEYPDVNHDIVYKLHPREYDSWRDEYPWLLDADFEVIDNSEPPLYELFSESNVQVGVGSTAVYEGLAFGLETFVYDCPGSEALQPLVDEGAARPVSDLDELAVVIGTGGESFDQEYYFEPNATKNMCETLKELSGNATTYE